MRPPLRFHCPSQPVARSAWTRNRSGFSRPDAATGQTDSKPKTLAEQLGWATANFDLETSISVRFQAVVEPRCIALDTTDVKNLRALSPKENVARHPLVQGH